MEKAEEGGSGQGRGGQRLMRRRYEPSEMPGSRTRPVLLEIKMGGRCRDESEYRQHGGMELSP